MYKGVQSFDCAFDLGKSIISSHDFTTTGRASRRLIRLRLMVILFIQFHIAIVIIITIIIIIITVFNLRRVKRTKGNWEGVEKTAGHFFSWNCVKTFKNSRENLCSRALVFRLRYYQWECFWLKLKDLIQLASIPDPSFLIFWIYPWKRTLGSKYFV